MKRLSPYVIFVFTVFSLQSFAGTQWDGAKIEKISSDSVGTIHIKLSKQAASECDNKRILLLPTTPGRINPLLSRAMFAYTTGEELTILGTGECKGEFEVVREIVRT